jgi:hypothetical protein
MRDALIIAYTLRKIDCCGQYAVMPARARITNQRQK